MVTIDFIVFSILEISEADSYMELAFELGLTWQDPRLIFYNLKDALELNALTQDEKLRIWVPQVVFENTRDKSKTINDIELKEKRKKVC